MKNTEIFLEIAKTDLKAAKCLYEARLYPQAIFFLQQSVEKMMKAFGSIDSDFSLDILKNKVGHKPFMVFVVSIKQFVKTFEEKSGVSTSDTISGVFQQNPNDFMVQVKRYEKLYLRVGKIKGLSTFVLRTYLKKIVNQIRNPQFLSKSDHETEAFISSIEKFLKQKFVGYSNQIDTMCSTLNKYLHNIANALGPLTFLILILPASCVQDTRYPTETSNPLDLYKFDHSLVKSFGEVTEICDFVIGRLGDFFTMYKEIDNIEGQV
ncbi:MAG TPA: HEPN domain-containing protein [candidate division WOR-3 bacterium]|uniref:HEPN domain-containing protein n=1 Tax=candidate division WOR-3 bacterium TaxID=2052148 RepID=A0A9C9K0P0_UNCW3|nr:HEPN domain-containing protein [candidate division WOR-3 bacterium]